MLGYTAEAVSDAITLDPNELESARWMTRAEVRALGDSDTFRLPRADSISRQLVTAWLAEQD